jgi:hypothetical protein
MRKDSYCGLYCGACEIVNAKTDEDKKRVISIFKSFIPGWHATPEQLHCSGCKTDDVFVNCATCPIRPCAQSKKVEFCTECEDYPCEKNKFMKTISNQLPNLKHVKIIESNQNFIQDHGVDKWLVDQEAKWKCPKCGTTFSWYADECQNCRYNLKGIKDYETIP